MPEPHPEEPALICRCEEVTLDELKQQIEAGAISAEELKRYTRITMGPCQGRVCRPLLLKVWPALLQEVGLTLADTGFSSTAGSSPADLSLPHGARLPGTRPPVRTLRIGDLAGLEPIAPKANAAKGKEGPV